MILPYINMNPPRVYTCSPSWTRLPHPSPYHPSGSSQTQSILYPASNLDWWFFPYMILYMFQCHSPKFCVSDLLAAIKLSFTVHGIDILQTVYWLKYRTHLIFPLSLIYIWFRWQLDALDNRVDVAFLVALDWGVNMILINSFLPWGSHHTEFLMPKLYHEVTLSWYLDLTLVNYPHIIS